MQGSVGILAALPAHSLTHLNLDRVQGPVDGPAVSAALARLRNLQQLHIIISEKAPYSCLASVARLTRLTFLELGGYWVDNEQLHQLLAQPLPLRMLHIEYLVNRPPLDLSRLTQLQEFSCPSLLNAVFPSQLQQLVLGSVSRDETLQSVLQLQQLRRLTLCWMQEGDQAGVSCLAQLPALQQLGLTYPTCQLAAAAAPTWPRLPQLRELAVKGGGFDMSRQGWEAISNGAAVSTQLTKLVWLCGSWHGPVEHGAWTAPCAKLAALINLRDLEVRGGSQLLPPGDALALRALTGLTCLVLAGAGAGVGDEAAAALAGSCQQLRHLDLTGCNLVSMECLATVRQLAQLTELRLGRNTRLTRGLMLLTGLKQLQVLEVHRSAEVTDEVMESFWAAVRRQQL